MSNEEKITIIKGMIREYDRNIKNINYSDYYISECKRKKEAMQGLLDLYEKEKEEHKKECHNCDEYTARLGELETENRMLKSELEKEKEKNKKIENELEKHIKFCEQEAKGHLNNEICHISLKFNKRLLDIINEEE